MTAPIVTFATLQLRDCQVRFGSALSNR